MSTLENAIDRSREKERGIRWLRVLLGAVLSEVIVILVLLAIITAYSVVVAPGLTQAEYEEFGQLAGYYVAPATGALSTFAVVFWIVARRLKSHFVANGMLTGVFSVLLAVGFLATAKPEHRLMYIIAFVLRIAAAYVGGLAAQHAFRRASGN